MNNKISDRLATAKGVSVHNGKIRIAFRPPGERLVKKSLGIDPTLKNITYAERTLQPSNTILPHTSLLGEMVPE